MTATTNEMVRVNIGSPHRDGLFVTPYDWRPSNSVEGATYVEGEWLNQAGVVVAALVLSYDWDACRYGSLVSVPLSALRVVGRNGEIQVVEVTSVVNHPEGIATASKSAIVREAARRLGVPCIDVKMVKELPDGFGCETIQPE